MKQIIFISIFVLTMLSSSMARAIDTGVIAAINYQTITQTGEHLKQLAEAIQMVESLQAQVNNTQHLLDLATKASEGIDSVGIATDFKNIVVQTNHAIDELKSLVDTSGDMTSQWKDIFGSLDHWFDNANETFSSIDMSDKVNSNSYLIADSYQKLYQQNSDTVEQLVENSKNVNEKGAMKQIALEVAQLIQMENNQVYLLSQILKAQSIEQSNSNLERKSDAVKYEQENQGVRNFIGIVDSKTFGM